MSELVSFLLFLLGSAAILCVTLGSFKLAIWIKIKNIKVGKKYISVFKSEKDYPIIITSIDGDIVAYKFLNVPNNVEDIEYKMDMKSFVEYWNAYNK